MADANNSLTDHDHSGSGEGGKSLSPEEVDIDRSKETFTFEQDNSGNLILRGETAGVFVKFNQGGATEYQQVMRVDGGFFARSEFTFNTFPANYTPQDVRNVSSPSRGDTAYHDGSGSNTEGPAHYDGTDWISTVDGSTIA